MPSAADITGMKGRANIVAVTAYDYTAAVLCDRAGADIILVGDSAGMVMLGYEGTARVTLSNMVMFTEAVSRGSRSALIVSDMPFMTYQADPREAVRNAGRLVRAGAHAVKLEGGPEAAPAVKKITDAGIPVMGHIGLQPQTATINGGYRVQGGSARSADGLVRSAKSLEEAGAFAIVLEMVVSEAADKITESVSVPTIGIGSGPCDGQVLVLHDLLGMYDRMSPRFAKKYANLSRDVTDAVARYADDVRSGRFPEHKHMFFAGGAKHG